MCRWCVLAGKKLEQLPPCDTTFRLPATFLEDQDLVDWDAVSNLPESLAKQVLSVLVPLKTTGDGNCLLHAVSRFMFGLEVYYELLRAKMFEELTTHVDWYRSIAPQFAEEDWERIFRHAKETGSHLEFMHIFALANVIERPILVYASDKDMAKFGYGESGVAATFVPSRVGQARCKHCPVLLAWQTDARNHFVPVVQIAGREAARWPVLPPAFPNSLAISETYEDYIRSNGPSIDPPFFSELEGQRTQRADSRQDRFYQLLNIASGQIKRDPGKEKKSNDLFDNSYEEEDEKSGIADQYEAVLQKLSAYLKRQEQEQQEEAIQVMLKTLDKAKRKRLELQEEGKPIQRRAEWQGYAYDMVCAVQMGGPALRIIAWNLEDDIPQLARKFMSDNGFGDDQNYYVQLVSLLAKNSVLFASEEIERLASNQNDEIEQTEGMKSPRNPPPHSIAVHPPICKHVPKRRGDPIVYNQGKLDGIHKKLLEFNSEIAQNSATAHESASEAELVLLARALGTLRNIDPSRGTLPAFGESEFQLMNKLIMWPRQKLFPVLDILRLLILHQQAAEHYLAEHNRNGAFLPTLLAHLEISAQNSRANAMIALKFVANMFAQPALASVASKNDVMILNALMSLSVQQTVSEQQIRLPIANIVLNFSSILCEETVMTEGKQCALRLIAQLLVDEINPDTLYPLLVALGTLMYGDRETTAVINQTAGMEKLLKSHLASTETKIAEAVQDVIRLMAWV